MRKDITALEMKPGDGVVKVGAAVQLNLFAVNKRGGTDLIPGNMATWSSSDDRVGEVNRQGRLTPRRVGSLTITATYADKNVLAVFTVVD
jgi:Bacterial Ig-like domain (group 2)